MKIYTKITGYWDGQRYVVSSTEGYEHAGDIALCCGASGEQKSIFKAQSSFYEELRGSYKTVFGAAKGIFDKLSSSLSPTVAAGPNQRGFSAAEHAARSSAVTENTAQSFENASKALGEQQASRGGGNISVPNGVNDQQKEQLVQGAAASEAGQKNQIEQEDWATGRQNYQFATNALAAAPNVYGVAQGFANSANSAGNEAAQTAQQITQANQAWMGPVFGAIGGIAGAAIGKIPTGGAPSGGGQHA